MNDNERPLVSVIVPIYNAGEYLHKCLDSLVNQSLRDIEIIVVLDCPTDGSDKIVEEFAAKDSRIKIVSNKENQHIGKSRNVGLKFARGKYIGFCDHDDYCDVCMYELLYCKAEKENLDLVCSPYLLLNHNKENITRICLDDFPNVSPEALNRIIFETNIGTASKKDCKVFRHGTVWNKLFRADIITDHVISFIDTRKANAEDICFILDFTYYSTRAGFIKKPLYYHHTGIGNTGATYFYKQFEHTRYYFNYVKNFLIENGIFERYEKRWAQTVVLLTYSSIMSESKSLSSRLKRIKILRKNDMIVNAFKKCKTAHFESQYRKREAKYIFLRLLICLWNTRT